MAWQEKYGVQLDGWNRRFERGDTDIPSYYYERPELDATCSYYLRAWCDLVTERPVIATMASVIEGIIPRSKIKMYAEDDLGLIGEEIDLFISVMRRVETKSKVKTGDTEGVKKIVKNVAESGKTLRGKKPRVRHPR